MSMPEHLQKFFEQKIDENNVCQYCIYELDCNHCAVSGGPNGPIYAPCCDDDPETYIDMNALQEAYDEEMKEMNTRKAQVCKHGKWQDIEFMKITSGSYIRIFEGDGTPVEDKHGRTEFFAAGKPYINKDGVETIDIYMKEK